MIIRDLSYPNGLVVFPTFFNLRLNFTIGVHDLSHSQLLVLFLLTVQSFSIFSCKEYNQSDFGVDHLVMSICRDVHMKLLCCWKRMFAMTSVFSWQNSVSLCLASFCTPRPNLPVTPGISWLPTFAFSHLWWKGHLSWLLFQEGLVGLHQIVQL